MITASGIYRVSVSEANNPTYLKSGVYHVEVLGKPGRQEANFRSANGHSLTYGKPVEWDMQSGTYERLNMLKGFENSGRVVCIPVSEVVLDAVANSLHGLEWSALSEAQQILACKAGL
jgi:hypothetical protein